MSLSVDGKTPETVLVFVAENSGPVPGGTGPVEVDPSGFILENGGDIKVYGLTETGAIENPVAKAIYWLQVASGERNTDG